ncbi:hypothetical protein BOX15_Mlig026202g2, partial [Macrostomum lignano]
SEMTSKCISLKALTALAAFACLLPVSRGHTIEGVIEQPMDADADFLAKTRITVDSGNYLGFIRANRTFIVQHVPSGSFVVEAIHPNYLFEPMRVDVASSGKIRARKLNFLQPALVKKLTYPLRFVSLGRAAYFQQREQLRTLDLLMNPSVLIMVVPMLILLVMPKLMNTQDPEVRKEMQQQMNFFSNKQNMPDVAETLSNWFGGGGSSGSRRSGSALKDAKRPGVKKRAA